MIRCRLRRTVMQRRALLDITPSDALLRFALRVAVDTPAR